MQLPKPRGFLRMVSAQSPQTPIISPGRIAVDLDDSVSGPGTEDMYIR